ncbi:MAG: hypothetical protein EHM61_19485 [Acidobacteria bacterium]|nr:MAG: hypothetical protein EHM61_19485 [Acidobacteriota bacterium]
MLIPLYQNDVGQNRPNPGQVIVPESLPWLPPGSRIETLERRIEPPDGFRRPPSPERSFASWLRALPVKPGRPQVRLYNGQLKTNQTAHCAVLDIDVGNRNLQQCADAVMRLRAEYLRSAGCEDSVEFHFTSGDLVSWARWRTGERPIVSRNRVVWRAGSIPDSSYQGFRSYLDQVFTYAGSASLARELVKVADLAFPDPGDVYVQAGSPGHAVVVADVCINSRGERMFLLGQSYMPAQEIHILVNPGSSRSPWYPARSVGRLLTPEWTFDYRDLRRFRPANCGPEREPAQPPS